MYQYLIDSYISPGAHVLDLGCGDGSLLHALKTSKNIRGFGLEIDAKHINECISKGINVIEQDIDKGLANFNDDSFDVVLMTQALQVMKQPDAVLAEMLRVGKECIVTFPNFGHWKARTHLLLRGRMPVSDLLPFEWYNTPNIHFCTIKDFEVLCRDMNITILDRQVTSVGKFDQLARRIHPNLFGDTALYHLTKR